MCGPCVNVGVYEIIRSVDASHVSSGQSVQNEVGGLFRDAREFDSIYFAFGSGFGF
jgi:hypothetical protein